MLDNISYQIIKALSKDGRYSYTKLAKDLKVKTSTVSNRVNKMLRDDFISIQAIPNPYKIGYKFQVVIALNVNIKQIDAVCDKLLEDTYISSIADMFGIFNILILAEYPDIEKLYTLVRKKLPNIEGVYEIDMFFISERKKSYDKFFKPESLIDEPVSIDYIDEQLISDLRKNGRSNLTRLAKKYGISAASVTRRVAKLIKNDIIKISVVPNHTKLLGFRAVAYVLINAEPNKVDSICEQLSTYPEVHNVITLVNRYNIFAVLVLKDHATLYKFITNEISLINGVIKIDTLMRNELRKRTYVYIDEHQLLNETNS
jgi:Lrp/AsnC family transcriptional regulator for asnA, asnC and gidA